MNRVCRGHFSLAKDGTGARPTHAGCLRISLDVRCLPLWVEIARCSFIPRPWKGWSKRLFGLNRAGHADPNDCEPFVFFRRVWRKWSDARNGRPLSPGDKETKPFVEAQGFTGMH
ncbi:hypothetical protein ZHAS_00007839 [Anopheles sinensis]|uniref:Uncharacterized protein n=1 Tax=Anopheles sinensis TaxID=74873 RepID=A0A084VQM5_ANOSI|nr:hypothetical protein ZHAS_00007839 [Anopheles sinensis]